MSSGVSLKTRVQADQQKGVKADEEEHPAQTRSPTIKSVYHRIQVMPPPPLVQYFGAEKGVGICSKLHGLCGGKRTWVPVIHMT